jgi:hypothetical protein
MTWFEAQNFCSQIPKASEETSVVLTNEIASALITQTGTCNGNICVFEVSDSDGHVMTDSTKQYWTQLSALHLKSGENSSKNIEIKACCLIVLLQVSFRDLPWAENTPDITDFRSCLRAVRRGDRVTLFSSKCVHNHPFLCLADDDMATNPGEGVSSPENGYYRLYTRPRNHYLSPSINNFDFLHIAYLPGITSTLAPQATLENNSQSITTGN